ncbi:hypothetical protein A45J_0525 [hot springs metagenome]|uniref:Uncharacterized protein n=1 Tax=hot springs metagenome TaxID=433727 RepID=A0A5J4L3J0_9ZZZZ
MSIGVTGIVRWKRQGLIAIIQLEIMRRCFYGCGNIRKD